LGGDALNDFTMEAITAEINEVKLKINSIEDILHKSFETWSDLEKRVYGNHELLREEKKLLQEEKIQLREKENKLREEKTLLLGGKQCFKNEVTRIKLLYSFAHSLSVELPNEDCDDLKDLDEWRVEQILMVAFFDALEKREISCLILDEAQKNLDLVEFLVKSTGADRHGTCRLIISGTPPCGAKRVDYGGSIRARTAQVSLSTLWGYEVRSFLNASFNSTISNLCWLDFWTMFNGEPGLYQHVALLLNRTETEKKNWISIHGVHDGKFSIFAECTEFSRENKKINIGIDEDLMENIGVQKKRQDVCSEKGPYFELQQKRITELLQKGILMGMSTLTGFITKNVKRGKVLAWKSLGRINS
jgi:hypothetical protein